jgi:A/G-specific adenine glycosylase
MLQQTTVAAVIPYFESWMRRFPDAGALAAASENDVLHAWQGLGYYARARNLHAAAKQIARGGWPDELMQLPGVGRYTANAISTFAFDRAVPVVEANIARLLSRLTNYQYQIDNAAGAEHLWPTAEGLLPKRGARAYNSALMDLGATICVAGAPRCGECPVRSFCTAINPASLPQKKPRATIKKLKENHAYIRRNGSVLLEQAEHRWRGMWILPRLTGEPHAAPIHQSKFPFTHHRITLAVFSETKFLVGQHHRWFAVADLAAIPLPSPHRRALNALLSQQHRSSTSPGMPRKVQPCVR